ncbi:MAG: cell division protein FtsZ, partial [Patescibacteria group bacterium]
VVTKPFTFEGAQRKRIADEALDKLAANVDTIITIPNDRVLQIIDKKTALVEAFRTVDEVLRQGVQGISELITIPGLINVDFADVRAIMSRSGSALMGIGHASGENRAVEAAKQAIASPLLEISIEGAKGILFTITGGLDLGMQEVAEAAKVITGSADDDARVIFGANISEGMGDAVAITVVATGFEGRERPAMVYGTSVVSASATWAPPVTRVPQAAPLSDFAAKMREKQEEPVFSKRVLKDEPKQRTASATTPVDEQEESAQSAKSQEQSDEDVMDIPAFIRKKMM